jgi:hypothetical protein
MVLSEETMEKIPTDTTGDRSRDRPTSSAAPLTTTLSFNGSCAENRPCLEVKIVKGHFYTKWNERKVMYKSEQRRRWLIGNHVLPFAMWYRAVRRRRKAKWISHILHRNCLLKHFVEGKGKWTPLQTWTRPEVSRRLRLPDFKTIGSWKW